MKTFVKRPKVGLSNNKDPRVILFTFFWIYLSTTGSRYSRMDQVKFAEDSHKKILVGLFWINLTQQSFCFLNPIIPNVIILYHLKISEEVYGKLGENWLIGCLGRR